MGRRDLLDDARHNSRGKGLAFWRAIKGVISLFETPFVIGEVGSNWKRFKDGTENLALAKRQIFDATQCGVDAVKFQYFTYRDLYGTEGQSEYELPQAWLSGLACYARSLGIDFLCSAFSPRGVRAVDPFVKMHKIASSEALDPFILEAVRVTEKPFLISSGGMTREELSDMQDRAVSEAWPAYFLNCVAEYPAKASDYSLQANFQGISDHTLTSELAVAAVGRGQVIFEKHFDALLLGGRCPSPTPDTGVSIGPLEMSHYVTSIREAFGAVGKSKTLSPDSTMARKWRRRLKVTSPLKGGQDRLEYGVNFGSFRSVEEDTRAAAPHEWERFQGKRVKRDLAPQDGLWFNDVE